MAFHDLTQGSVPRNILRLALPVLAFFVMQSLYTLADLYFVGLLGGAPLAGLAIAANVFFLVLALGRTIGVGALAILSQAYGGGQHQRVTAAFRQALALVAVLGGGGWILGYLATDAYFGFLTQDPRVHAEGAAYLRIFSATILLQLFLMVNGFAWRALGDFHTPNVLMGGSVLLNLALDPLLIFGWGPVPALGIAGAAWATVTSQAAACLVFLWLIFFGTKNPLLRVGLRWRIEWNLLARMLRIGLPSGLDFLFLTAVTIIMFRFIAPFGADATAAVGVGFRLVNTAFLPPVAVAAAVASLVGQNYGAQKLRRVRVSLVWGAGLAFVLMGLEYGLFLLSPHFWVGLFASAPGIVAIGVKYLTITGMGLPLMGLTIGIVFGLQGMGRTLQPLIAMTARLATFVALLLVLESRSLIRVDTIFLSNVAGSVVEAAIMVAVLVVLWRTVLATPGDPAQNPAAPGEPANPPPAPQTASP